MDLNFFNQKGYVVIKNQIESQHLNKLIISSKNVLKKYEKLSKKKMGNLDTSSLIKLFNV